MKYAFIQSSDGTVWSASTTDYTLEYIQQTTGFPVDLKLTNGPDNIQPKGSGLDWYHRWTGFVYEVVWVLEDLKAAKNLDINMRTREIIAEGVSYDNRIFPLDLPDQSTWHGIFNAVAAGMASYPIKVMDTNDEPYYLNTALEFQTMYFTGFGAVLEILESGRALKAQVNACTTKEQIDAIVDPR